MPSSAGSSAEQAPRAEPSPQPCTAQCTIPSGCRGSPALPCSGSLSHSCISGKFNLFSNITRRTPGTSQRCSTDVIQQWDEQSHKASAGTALCWRLGLNMSCPARRRSSSEGSVYEINGPSKCSQLRHWAVSRSPAGTTEENTKAVTSNKGEELRSFVWVFFFKK